MTNTIGFVLFLVVLICVGMLVFGALFQWFVPDSSRATIKPRVGIFVSERQATIIDQCRSWTYLVCDGQETFFPKAHEHGVYELTLCGVLRGDDGQRADAFYRTDGDGNFSHGVNWLRVNGYQPSDCEFLEQDRCTHRYRVRIPHAGPQLTLALHRWANGSTWSGALMVEVAVLPPGTMTSRQLAELARREAEEERKRVEHKQKAAKAATQFAEQVRALAIRSQAFENWESSRFRKNFAEVHCDDLIQRQGEIREETITFLSQHDIIRYFERHDPAVIERFTGQLVALLMAEKISLERRLKSMSAVPAQPPPPRKKLTADDVRRIKLHRQQVQDQDRVALKMDKIETRLRIRERLETMPLDPDEREMLEQELIGEIEQGDDNARTI